MITPSQRVSETKESYIRNILKAISQPGMLSLAGGLPDASRFPLPILQAATDKLMDDPSIFQYGPTEGLPALRSYINQHYPYGEDCIVTTGSQQALDLIARAYLNPNDNVLCEAPSYLGALQVFDLAQVNTLSVVSERDGPCLQDLERQLSNHSIKLFYAVPDFHNPTCRVWSDSKRLQVAKLLAKYNVAFIEDAPYREIRFEGQALPTVTQYLEQAGGDSFYLGSFSKIATPSMRVGFVKASAALLKPISKVKQASDLHSALPMQQMLLETISHPDFEQHLVSLSLHYKERRDALVKALNRELSEHIQFDVPEGGMFVWVELKQHLAKEVAAAALKESVAVVPGDEFWPRNTPVHYQAIRLNFTALSCEQLGEAVQRLAKVMKG